MPLLVAAALTAAACSSTEAPESEPEDTDAIPQLEPPPADGPRLVALRHGLLVWDRPSASGRPLGSLRAGAEVVRAAEPYSKKDCEAGWYPIRPRGFVCASADVTLEADSPVARALKAAAPQLDRPLPYRYGRVRRGSAVIYRAAPSAEEQIAAEPKLGRRRPQEPVPLGAGANDLLLGEDGMPTGPPVVRPDGDGVGADGRRSTATFFTFPSGDAPPEPIRLGAPLANAEAPTTQVLKRRSGVAITRSFIWDTGEGARRFGLMPDGRLIPTDRLRPALGSTWHGIDVREVGLPVAFTVRAGVCPYQLDRGKATRLVDEELEPHQAIALTGRFRTVDGVKYFFTRDNRWIRHRDTIYAFRRHRFPDFAVGEQKWLDISLANQTLVAYRGKSPIYATLISSGQNRLGDPAEGPSTAQGVFRVLSKHVTAPVDDREVGQTHSILEAPWVAVFAEGFAITGSYWLRDVGEAQSYHNIALTPVDAHWLWRWADPQLPEGWHGVVADEDGPNTIVYVHK